MITQDSRGNNIGLETVQEIHHLATFRRANTQFTGNAGDDLDETFPIRFGNPHTLVSNRHSKESLSFSFSLRFELETIVLNEHQIRHESPKLHDEMPKFSRKFVKNSPKTHQTRYC